MDPSAADGEEPDFTNDRPKKESGIRMLTMTMDDKRQR